MNENFESCFKMMIASEGGFVDHPKDPGGMTNLGVTRGAWEAWLKRPVTEVEMRAFTPDKVKPFYKAMYWNRIKGDSLPSGLDYAMFDYAVNSGPNKASKDLQRIIAVPVDGIIGPKSLAAVETCDVRQAIEILCEMRMEFLKSLPGFETFGKGWSDRVGRVKAKALSMAGVA